MNLEGVLRALASGVFAYVIVAACGSGTASINRASMGEVADAHAQTTQTGRLQVTTADSDPAQQVGGFRQVGGGAPVELVAGPVFITDLRAVSFTSSPPYGHWLLYTVPSTDTCSSQSATVYDAGSVESFGAPFANIDAQTSIHGARMLVSANKKLCVSTSDNTQAGIRWAGFSAY